MQKIEKSCKFRSAGFARQLTDAEVITIEICGEFFKLHEETEIDNYLKRHYLHFFPRLPSRTTFVRQSANLWQAKVLCQPMLARLSSQTFDPVQAIDTLPLPVGTDTRGGRRDRRFATLAQDGHCAAKGLNYYGFKLGWRISRSGFITPFPLFSARARDTRHLGSLIEGFTGGSAPADTGFIDEYQSRLWCDPQQMPVVTAPRRTMPAAEEQIKLVARTKYWRKLLETVGSQLADRFQITKIKVKDLRHYQNRLYRKILSHPVGVFLNMQAGTKPLQLALLTDL